MGYWKTYYVDARAFSKYKDPYARAAKYFRSLFPKGVIGRLYTKINYDENFPYLYCGVYHCDDDTPAANAYYIYYASEDMLLRDREAILLREGEEWL